MDRCQTVVMGHQCTKREGHKGNCKFKDFVPPSERLKKQKEKAAEIKI